MIEQTAEEIAEAMKANPKEWADIYLMTRGQLDDAVAVIKAFSGNCDEQVH